MNRFALVLVNGVVQEMPINDRIEHSANIPRQANAPSPAVSGDQWFDTSTSRFMLYDGSQWTTVGGDNASAIATANQALAATADVYKEVANVAAISASPANGDKIELLDSTGVQSFSPLSGLPSGFVGASNLLVRLEYNSSGSSWEFRSFAAKDPDGRYVKNAANYTLTLPASSGSNGNVLKTDGSGNASWGSADVVADTTPQLGGDLDCNANNITGTVLITGSTPSLRGTGASGSASLSNYGTDTSSVDSRLELQPEKLELYFGSEHYLDIGSASGSQDLRIMKDGSGIGFYGGSASNYLTIRPPATFTTTTYVLPAADGSAGQAIITDGNGVLSFGNVGGQFVETPQTLTENKVIAANINASCNGPIALDSGVTVTVGSNSSLAIRN
jgi:hypothetical protein|tara:strand:- start:604 stop:1770 length:1167 start_codon:yes stop_codon:yes gene_type:complete